jgi:hypothetical protein
MANGNAARTDALVGYALARYDEAGGVPVLVVEEGDGDRRSVVRGRFTHPFEKDRLVEELGTRTRSVKRGGAVVWTTTNTSIAPVAVIGSARPVRYVYCTTPEHRAGVLLAQRYSAAGPVGAPQPVDPRSLAPGWRPVPLSPLRSPVERLRWVLAQVTGRARTRRTTSAADGPPARHHSAITGSQIAQPNDESGSNASSGLPARWCSTSQPVCSSQPTPMNAHESRPRKAQ